MTKILSPLEEPDEVIAANRKIIRAYKKVEQAAERLKETRKDWNAQLAEEKVSLRGVIEADTVAVYAKAQAHLDHIKSAWQVLEETIAGRKMELHEALEDQREAKRAFGKAMDNASQLELPGVDETD